MSTKVYCRTLKVDLTYQRPTDEDDKRVKEIADNWDDRQARKLYVSKRKNGSYYVIDGNHTRIAAMKVYGMDATLDAEIYTGLTVEDEADLFYKLNTNSKAVTFNEKLKARLARGDEDAIEYVKALDESDILYSFGKGGGTDTKPIFVGHAAGTTAFRLYGKDAFVRALNIVSKCTSRKCYMGGIVQALTWIIYKRPDVSDLRLWGVLINYNIAEIENIGKQFGRTVSSGSSLRYPIALAIATLYDKGLHKYKLNLTRE